MYNFKKGMGTVLSVVMIASALVGCSAKDKNKEKVENQSTTINNVKLPEGTKLTFWDPQPISPYAKTLNDSDYYKTIQEKTGIALEMINKTSPDALSLAIATGEIPDIIADQDKSYPGGVSNALASGLIIPISDLLNKGYAPNYKALLDSDPEMAKLLRTDDGKYYSFGSIGPKDGFYVFAGLIVRDDWMKELNLSAPKTMADLEKILLAFKEKKGCQYGFSGSWNGYGRLLNAFDTDEKFINVGGKVKYGYTEPGYKEFLTTFSKWMKEGIVDPDIFTQNQDAFYTKVSTGKVGMVFGYTGGEFNKFETFKKSDPKMNFTALPNVASAEGKTMNVDVSASRLNAISFATISSKCKYPEAAAKVLDFLYSKEGIMLGAFGKEGKTYTMENGQPKLTEFMTKNPDGYSMTQVGIQFSGPQNKVGMGDARATSQTYALPQQQESIKLWATNGGKITALPVLTFTPAESTEYNAIISDLNTYSKEMKMKFILGAEPISNFDNFVANLKKMKLDRAIEIQQAALDRLNKR